MPRLKTPPAPPKAPAAAEALISTPIEAPISPADDLTPAMRQYRDQKQQAGQAILLFRMGDFYEMFYEDAQTAARVLGIALTSRDNGRTPLAGIPYHALESYLAKLVAAGHKVAISEQIEDARVAKGVVKRAIVRIVTPGTLTDEALLDRLRSNILAAVCISTERGGQAGIAAVELASGELTVRLCAAERVLDELSRIAPAEVLLPEADRPGRQPLDQEIQDTLAIPVSYRSATDFAPHRALDILLQQFQVATLEGFGFEEVDLSLQAAAGVLAYLDETQKTGLTHIRPPVRRPTGSFLELDAATLRSLEVERTLRSGGRDGTLLSAVDHTRNPMGARLLRQWLCYPLRDATGIQRRQNLIESLRADAASRAAVRACAHDIGDMERRIARVAINRTHPRELRALGNGLSRLAPLRELLRTLQTRAADELAWRLEGLDDLGRKLCDTLRPDAPIALRDGAIFMDGFNAELDRLRRIGSDGQSWLTEYQAREAQRAGIPALKVGFNKVFGYYIEITHAQKARIPADFVRKQTVKNAERYITDELKRYETEVLSAESRANELEYDLFSALRAHVAEFIPPLQAAAAAVAEIDVLAGWAELSLRRQYCRPEFIPDSRILEIRDGRHPVVEQTHDASFVPNDTHLCGVGVIDAGIAVSTGAADFQPLRSDGAAPAASLQAPDLALQRSDLSVQPSSLALITGPNMAGKSTYIRQVALLTLLAHAGSWVPARSMRLGLVDRIFTRVGASDELSRGQSTFMVEMLETANILHNATARSLVILDEVGRGTSTFDGLALAWAIAEQLAASVGCRTLFATHYHELTELANLIDRVCNLNVAVREFEDQIAFLHRIVPGSADRSYGLHVAKLAGIPRPVLERANAVLNELERTFGRQSQRPALAAVQRRRTRQLRLFEEPEETIVRELRDLPAASLDAQSAPALIAKWRQLLGLSPGASA